MQEELENLDNSKQEEDVLCGKCEGYKTGWQRAQADYQNLQKEVSEKRGEWIKMSEVQVLEDFIPVYDNFKKAFSMELGTVNKEQESWIKGIEFIMKQFYKVLKDRGVEEVSTVGELFDPNQHEAVGEEVVEGRQEGEVVREVESGYKKDNKIIKVAKVILVKNNN